MSDMICALSTPPGKSGIAVVRVSGDGVHELISRCFSKPEMQPRVMYHGVLKDGDDVIDDCMATVFAAPASFTGEDMAELYLHGGTMPQRMAIELLLKLGARLAEPGEFSKRAYSAGKIDLTKAEAIIELINAQTEAQAKNALYSVRGGLSRRIESAIDSLTDVIAYIEAVIEYPEEDFDSGLNSGLCTRIADICSNVRTLADSYAQGRLLDSGYRVAIAGRPNVGKSSLLNALLSRERSIVTDIAGTTRDIVDATVDIRGLCVRFFDTAGIRKTNDVIESIGVERSLSAVSESELTIFAIDAACGMTDEDAEIFSRLSGNTVIALNKMDISGGVCAADLAYLGVPCIEVCAADSTGIDSLREFIYDQASMGGIDGYVITSERHFNALCRARDCLDSAVSALRDGLPHDMAGIDLRCARAALGEICGDTVDEHIVDRIFENFCLGK